jgi:biotin/methionine sulfoxide reductase
MARVPARETDDIVKDAAWAAPICDDASVIRGLCQRMTAHRTMLSMSWSIQRADPWRAAVLALAAFHGQPLRCFERKR